MFSAFCSNRYSRCVAFVSGLNFYRNCHLPYFHYYYFLHPPSRSLSLRANNMNCACTADGQHYVISSFLLCCSVYLLFVLSCYLLVYVGHILTDILVCNEDDSCANGSTDEFSRAVGTFWSN